MQRMTEEEIRRDHRLAKHPNLQLRILADMNGVTSQIIQRIILGQTWEDAMAKALTPCEGIAEKEHKGRGRAWSDKELMIFAKRRHEGHTLKEIAKELGRTVCSLKGAMENHPEMFATKKLYREFSEEDERVAIESYKSGMTMASISERLGRAPGTVRTFLIRKGIMR